MPLHDQGVPQPTFIARSGRPRARDHVRAGAQVRSHHKPRRHEADAIPFGLAIARRPRFDAPAGGQHELRFALVEQVHFELAAD